jgi:uncharacterized Ntn-hydrolase superfamily protein
MTYTILATDADRGQVGIGITTLSIGVGGLAPFFSADGDIVTTQAYARADLGPVMVRALNVGAGAEAALAAAREYDGDDDVFRQLAIIRRTGEHVCHTGTSCRPWAGHIDGDGWVVMGNVLSGRAVLEAMADAFTTSAAENLSERLLRALEAGRDAGGQAMPDGRHLRERSAMVRVLADDLLPVTDLRVDLHADAVTKARRLATIYTAIGPYNDLRGRKPAETPSIPEWEPQHLAGLAVPEPFG